MEGRVNKTSPFLFIWVIMENEKKSPKVLFRKAVPILFFIVLPAISWYYLSGGLKWRIDAVSEINHDYGKIRQAWMILPNMKKIDLLQGRVCVIRNFGENPDLTEGNKIMLDQGEQLFKQFGQVKNELILRDKFRIVAIADNGTAEFKSHAQTLPSTDMATWVFTGGVGSWESILNNSYEKFCLDQKVKPVDYYWAVTDTAGTIRRFYDALDPKQVERMVQHIAILLPKDDN